MTRVRTQTLNFSARQLQVEAGLVGASSLRTVYRKLSRGGFRFGRLKKKGVLSNEDLKVRRRWVKQNASRPLSYWMNISMYVDAVSFIYKPHPHDTARASRAKAWLRKR